MSDKTVKNVILDLLCEIRDICEENNIPYSLYGSTAAKALTIHDLQEPFAQIMVNNSDFIRLCNIMEKKKLRGRIFDSMHNNPNYMDYSARYSNTETTNVSIQQKGNIFMSGLYVEIIPIRIENNTRTKHFFLRFIEHGWEKHYLKLTSIGSWKYLLTVPVINFFRLIFGKKKVSKWIFNKMAKGHSGEFTVACSVKSFNQTLSELNFEPLKKVNIVRVCGKNFSIAEKSPSILRKVYSRGWRKKALTTIQNQNNIVLLNVSYKQFERALIKHSKLWKKYFRKKSRQMFVKAISSYYDRQKNKVWALAKRTGTRARLYFYYMPKMGLIRNLVKNEDYYRLSNIMLDNRIATLLAYKQDTGFAVNKELFEIQMMLFRFEGNNELADRLEAITPKYYMEPIVKNARQLEK